MEDIMRKVKWISPEEDFETLFKNGEYEKLTRLSEENENLLFELYQKKDSDNLHNSIQFGKFLLKYFKRLFCDEIKSLTILYVGKLMGYIELLNRISFAEEQNQIVRQSAQYCGTKHLDDVIFALETRGSMSQSELAEKLEMQASTLSESLKKIRKTGFVQVMPYGKYKMYSLTDEGIRYGALRRKKKKPEYLQAIDVLDKYMKTDEKAREECLNQMKIRLEAEGQKLIAKDDEMMYYERGSREYGKMTVRSILRTQSNSKTDDTIVVERKALRSFGIEDNEIGAQLA